MAVNAGMTVVLLFHRILDPLRQQDGVRRRKGVSAKIFLIFYIFGQISDSIWGNNSSGIAAVSDPF